MNLMRQFEVFQPEKHKDTSIMVIGAGTIGSNIVNQMVRVGLEDISVYDHDIVEEHNVPNQLYGIRDVGKKKISALADIISRDTDVDIDPQDYKIDKETILIPYPEIIILAIDTMSGRKEIWNSHIKNNENIKFMIETRMGAYSGRVYSIDPSNENHIKKWEETLCDDDEAEVSACGASISMAPMGCLIASLAVWNLIKWFNKGETENEAIISVDPIVTLTRNFS